MNLTFKAPLQKGWVLLDDKILYGDREILLSQVEDVRVVIKGLKGKNGLIQIKAVGKVFNLAYPSKMWKEGDEAIIYLQEHHGSIETKNNRKSMKEVQAEIEALPYKDNWNAIREISELPKILHFDEHIKAMAAGFLDGKICLLVCTEKRFFIIDSKIISGTDALTIPLDRITSISNSRGVLFGKITIADGTLRRVVDKVSNTTVEFFANTVNKQIEEYKKNSYSASIDNSKGLSSADEILKFKELLDMGVITEDEFQVKKKELLGL